MIDWEWEVILLIILLVFSIGLIWFFTIKDMVIHFRYLESQKKTNQAYNDKGGYEPEPICVGVVEKSNYFNSLTDKPNNTCYTNGNSRCFPRPTRICFIIRHILRSIISKVTPNANKTLFWKAMTR